MDEGTPVRPRQAAAEAAASSAENYKELFRAVSAEEADMKRRELLFELSLALGGAPALTLLRHLEPGEEERLARVIQAQGRVDAETVATIEKLTAQCRRLDDTYGPAKVLPVVEAQRDMVTRLLSTQTLLPGLRTRLVHTYAELAQLSGFLHFDRMNYPAARHALEEGLAAAVEIDDAVLAAYIHHWGSAMASYAEQPGTALDHALATQGWAHRSTSNLIRALAEYDEARALSFGGHERESLRRLDTARTWARKPTSGEPDYLYWVTESAAIDGAGCHVLDALGRSDDVIKTTKAQLTTCGAGYTRERAIGLIHQGMALAQKKEIPEAAAKLSEAITLMQTHSSARLGHLLTQARKRLEPWSGNTHVRNLDKRLQVITA